VPAVKKGKGPAKKGKKREDSESEEELYDDESSEVPIYSFH
jgi:hypothetical protein